MNHSGDFLDAATARSMTGVKRRSMTGGARSMTGGARSMMGLADSVGSSTSSFRAPVAESRTLGVKSFHGCFWMLRLRAA